MTPKQQREKEEKELQRLLRLREETEIAIAKAKRRIAAWTQLMDDTETGELVVDLDMGGLTEACSTVMRSSRKVWMTIADIQEDLRELGFPLQDYKAPTASITTTVNRLVESGVVVVEKRTQAGANEYKWVGPSTSIGRRVMDMARRGQR
jgi:hypothetical protein